MTFSFYAPELPLDPRDVRVGEICYLQDADLCPITAYCDRADVHEGENSRVCQGTRLRHGAFSHPVVIIEVKQNPGSTVVGDLVCRVSPVSTHYLFVLI
jgi:hypothetical protein